MQADRFTIKSQEALQAAIAVAAARHHTETQPEHLLLALLEQPESVVGPVLRKLGARRRRSARDLNAALDALPDDHRRRQGAEHQPRADRRPARRRARGRQAQRRVHLDRAHPARADRRPGRRGRRRSSTATAPRTRTRSRRIEAVRGPHRVTDQSPEDKYQALQKFGRDLTAGRRGRQARPGHRPRRRDPPRDPGPLPPHQEQPRADRRARRRQDRDRRGPRPADRLRRHPRVASATARSSASTSAPCSPAPSTAASSRSA